MNLGEFLDLIKDPTIEIVVEADSGVPNYSTGKTIYSGEIRDFESLLIDEDYDGSAVYLDELYVHNIDISSKWTWYITVGY